MPTSILLRADEVIEWVRQPQSRCDPAGERSGRSRSSAEARISAKVIF
jgi:hypothetical protein